MIPVETINHTGLSLAEPQYGTVSNSVKNDSNLKKLVVGSQNTTPTDPNQPGTPGGSTPTSDPNQPKKQEAQLLTYPSYIKPDQDRIKFQACEIKSRGGSLINTPQYTKVGSPVFMAIQAPISDQNSVDWGPDTVNAIDGEGAARAVAGVLNQSAARSAGLLVGGTVGR